MKSKYRSLSGAALMLVIIPIFVGILACMPEHVPLGNPDRARIDPDISGIWIVTSDEGHLGSLAVFQPWDKHTWMLTNVILDEGVDADWSVYDLESYDGIVALLENETWGRDGSGIDGMLIYKAWLTKITGEQFLTIDARGMVDEDGSLDSLFTVDYRLIKKSPDEFHVQMINEDYGALQDVPATPRAWEKVIRRNKDDGDLYVDDVSRFHRVRPEHTKLFSEIVAEAFGIL